MAKSCWQESADALPSLSIRLPAVIGRGSKRNWPSECLRKLKAGEPLDYFNPEAPFNNVVHERDIAALVEAVLQRGLSGADMVIAGADGRTTIAEAVRLLVEATGSPSPVTAQTRDRAAFLIDSGKAERLFGFAPMDVLAALRQFVQRQRLIRPILDHNAAVV